MDYLKYILIFVILVAGVFLTKGLFFSKKNHEAIKPGSPGYSQMTQQKNHDYVLRRRDAAAGYQRARHPSQAPNKPNQ